MTYSDIFVGKPPYFEQSKPRKSMTASPAKKKEYKKKEPKIQKEQKTPNEPKIKKIKSSHPENSEVKM